ncbi:MAG: hypothetical protein ACQET5_01840 [Halobacteriota archaeon]|uniref:hypothetical protein n=1 Tax=Natronomonas sp. TaxID=2184060 RepID=UPI003974EB59
MEADGLDPETDQPTYDWLNERGFRTLLYTLQEHHDTTFSEFWSEDLDLEHAGFDWYVNDGDTVDDTDDLLSPVARESHVPAHEAVDAGWATFDVVTSSSR